MISEEHRTLLGLTVQIVSAHVQKNQVPAPALPALIEQVYAALSGAAGAPAVAPAEKQQPFVPAKRSIFPDYIICLEDGRKLKTLKRHLRSEFNLTPEQYREKWGLAADYPMVAPNYAAHRSELAKALGLGRKPAEAEPASPRPAPARAPEPRRRADLSADAVFSKFPKGEAPAEPVEPPPRRAGRKPFSSQRTRGMKK